MDHVTTALGSPRTTGLRVVGACPPRMKTRPGAEDTGSRLEVLYGSSGEKAGVPSLTLDAIYETG